MDRCHRTPDRRKPRPCPILAWTGGILAGVFLLACSSGDEQSTANASGAGGSATVTSASAATSSGSSGGGSEGTGGSGGVGGDGGAGGAGGGAGGGPGCSRFVTGAIQHIFGSGQDTGQDLFPAPILGPPKGAGCCAGSSDVVSLGDGGTVTVEFAGAKIVNGPGPDFIVFENPFNVGGDPQNPYAELASVEVSEDGVTWSGFSCTATKYPYEGCAGWHPVLANAESNTINPTDPAVAGGDPFDLEDIGVAAARYVRITDRADLSTVFDLDAVSIVNASCP